MPQVFLGYVKVSGSDYRKSIYRTAIGNPQLTDSDAATVLSSDSDTSSWLISLLESSELNTFYPLPEGIPADVKTDIEAMFVDVLADATPTTKSAIKLSLVDWLHDGYDEPVITLKAVITSAGVKSVAYFPLVAAEEA